MGREVLLVTRKYTKGAPSWLCQGGVGSQPSIGPDTDTNVNCRLKLILSAFFFLVLLVGSWPGAGQQAPAGKFESLVATAQKAQAGGDFAAAAHDYQEAVELSPGFAELWANLGLMQHESGNIVGAIASFQHAQRLKPSLYVPNLFLGIDLVRSGKTDDAIAFLVKAERINPSDPQAELALGRAYVAEEKYAAAVRELSRATTLDPKLGAAWFTLGIARLDQVEAESRALFCAQVLFGAEPEQWILGEGQAKQMIANHFFSHSGEADRWWRIFRHQNTKTELNLTTVNGIDGAYLTRLPQFWAPIESESMPEIRELQIQVSRDGACQLIAPR